MEGALKRGGGRGSLTSSTFSSSFSSFIFFFSTDCSMFSDFSLLFDLFQEQKQYALIKMTYTYKTITKKNNVNKICKAYSFQFRIPHFHNVTFPNTDNRQIRRSPAVLNCSERHTYTLYKTHQITVKSNILPVVTLPAPTRGCRP